MKPAKRIKIDVFLLRGDKLVVYITNLSPLQSDDITMENEYPRLKHITVSTDDTGFSIPEFTLFTASILFQQIYRKFQNAEYVHAQSVALMIHSRESGLQPESKTS